MTPQKFRTIVRTHYTEHGRHSLPWRATKDPYRILVSEIMLQQTQVDRVIPYYRDWLKKYPTVTALANASLADVLRSWQGLGYNRRAKMLHDAAKEVVKAHNGTMPRTVEELESLPGIGHYTARAVAAFAYNHDVVFIETNLRTAVLHNFFPDRDGVSDTQIFVVLEKAFESGHAREWYSALMDYGAHLKRSGIRTNARMKGHTKQSAFIGSGREVRGAILRTFSRAPSTKASLMKLFPIERKEQIEKQITSLIAEGLIQKNGVRYSLPA